jgi:hypothetical protein
MGGSSTLSSSCSAFCSLPGVYGTEYSFASSNWVGGRIGAASWSDTDGNIWLFGGHGFDSQGSASYLNDLWEYKFNAKAKKTQTITFSQPTSPLTYGAKPVTLTATGGDSGNPIVFSVFSGPGKVSGTNGKTLTFTAAGPLVVAANQAGSSNYSAAAQVKRSIQINKATLIVTANNLSMKKGASVPALTYAVTGFVNSDTASTSVTGKPKLTTSATSKSPVGAYAITVATGTLTAANYAFTFKNGTLTVAGSVATPVVSLKAGTYKSKQSLTLTDSTPGATIYYTTDKSTPSATHGTQYSTAISVAKSETVKAIAVLAGCTSSAVVSTTYTIQ